MFCNQCEQTSHGKACTSFGVCGKDPESSAIMDLILHVSKGTAMYLYRARRMSAEHDRSLEAQIPGLLFSVLTNTNFNPTELEVNLEKAVALRERARARYEEISRSRGKPIEQLGGPATFAVKRGGEMLSSSDAISIEARTEILGEDIVMAQELLTNGIKGACAYAYHAQQFGREVPSFLDFLCEAFDVTSEGPQDFEKIMALCIRLGEENGRVLEALDAAHTERYGNPEPTDVRVTPVKGKAILVSGHSLDDLESLLKSTSVNVYTHGELLPANAYPGLKKYRNLIGNYGGAWQDQAREFDAFPGPIVVTTNCLQKPLASYANRMFTTGPTSWPGVRHLDGRNWDDVREVAIAMPGFVEDAPEKRIRIGYGRTALLGTVDRMASLLKSGELKELLVVGGCDGAKLGRNHYTDLTATVPPNSMVMTFACGKYRFNKNEFGNLNELPRLLDVGQCNDSYSLLQFLSALSGRMGRPISELPISPVLSWFEQKSVAYMLTLFWAGVRSIQLGPTLPAFMNPAVFGWLKRRYGLQELVPLDKRRVSAMLN